MAKYHGIAVNFRVASAIGSVVGVFQSRDHSYEADNEMIKSGLGDTVEKTFYDLRETATFEYVASAAGGPTGAAAVTVPTVGDTMTVTDSVYAAIAGTTWLVDNVDVKGSNTTATRVTVKVARYPAITS